MHNVPTRGIGLTERSPLTPSFGIGEGESFDQGGGWHDRGRHRKRCILPDGRVFWDVNEALAALRACVGEVISTEIAKIPRPKIRAKLKKPSVKNALRRRDQLEKAALLLGEIPLPAVIERLPEPVRVKFDTEFIDLAIELIAQREEDDVIVLLLS